MKSAAWVLVGGAALAAMAVQASAARPVAPATTSPQQLIAARQSGMMLSAGVLGAMRGAAERGDAPKSQGFAARGLVKWSIALPALFPASTATATGSRAKPEIWTNDADFAAKAAAFTTAANALLAATQADDKAAFAAALATTAGTCKACHDAYQAPPPPRPAG